MKTIFTHIILFLLLHAVVFASENSPQSKAKTNDTVVYQIDTDSSYLHWYCDLHNGHIFLDSGYISMINNELVSGRFVICMESIVDLDIDNYELMRITLENTLKSIEFFNTPLFHHSYFEFDQCEKSDKGYTITGELELMGVAQCIDFDSKFELNNNDLTITSDSIIINRTHWGITSMSELDAKSNTSFIVPNDIGIVVHLVAIRE